MSTQAVSCAGWFMPQLSKRIWEWEFSSVIGRKLVIEEELELSL
jgi:hypothetical protein